MFRTIVVGTDGSERAARAVSRAGELAKTCGATLHVIHAYHGIESSVATAMAAGAVAVAPPNFGDLAVEEDAEENKMLEAQVKAVRDSGVDVQCHAVAGSAVDVILDVADRVGADLIVTGNRGMTGGKRFLGSVPNTVAHHAQCAVMIVPTDT